MASMKEDPKFSRVRDLVNQFNEADSIVVEKYVKKAFTFVNLFLCILLVLIFYSLWLFKDSRPLFWITMLLGIIVVVLLILVHDFPGDKISVFMAKNMASLLWRVKMEKEKTAIKISSKENLNALSKDVFLMCYKHKWQFIGIEAKNILQMSFMTITKK